MKAIMAKSDSSIEQACDDDLFFIGVWTDIGMEKWWNGHGGHKTMKSEYSTGEDFVKAHSWEFEEISQEKLVTILSGE